ncbi:unnamed protein product [Rangifer tarandus platyrhynchus]|uniref:Uncharacterized protein n=1 Tax=Rangifer tarandus platyrhynchus TaxID=3082113 RepID=A0ACB1KHC2_RANTA
MRKSSHPQATLIITTKLPLPHRLKRTYCLPHPHALKKKKEKEVKMVKKEKKEKNEGKVVGPAPLVRMPFGDPLSLRCHRRHLVGPSGVTWLLGRQGWRLATKSP